MQRVHLTKRMIDDLRFDPEKRSGNGLPATQQIVWDDELRGFGVRLQPGGSKAFVLSYRTADGRSRLFSIGRYGALTLAQARDHARRTLAAVLDGADPLEARRAGRQGMTLRQYADEYMRRHAKRRKRTWQTDRRRLDRNVLPKLGSRKLETITRRDVAALHSAIGERAPYEANRTVALLKVMRSRAIEWGHMPESAPSWSVKPFKERSRDRWVRPEELPILLGAIDAEESPFVRAALLLALLTGMRRGELLGLRWADVDLTACEIRLPNTKADRPHVVPLSQDAAEVLRELPRMLGNPYVLPSPTVAGAHMHDLKRPWDRVRARVWLAMHPDDAAELRAQAEADVDARSKHAERAPSSTERRLLALACAKATSHGETLRLHDVRRTTGSMIALAGGSLPLIGKVLNHSNAKTTQVYARLTDEAPRQALEQLAERVRAAAGGTRAEP